MRVLMVIWSLFIGLGAFWGSYCFWDDPTGVKWQMDIILAGLQRLPLSNIFFRNLIWPGVALFLVNGVTQIITTILILKNNKYASLAGMACGIILMLWVSIQFFLFSMNALSIAYFVFGFLEFATAFVWYKKEQEALLKTKTDKKQ